MRSFLSRRYSFSVLSKDASDIFPEMRHSSSKLGSCPLSCAENRNDSLNFSSILRLKSRHCGWLKQFIYDTALSYKDVTCAPVPGNSLYPTTMTTFEFEYI
jgi:hypothetical protein